MCSSNSPEKWARLLRTGATRASPIGQNECPAMPSQRVDKLSISPDLPRPASILSRISRMRREPTRQGVHLPHDSWTKKRIVRLTTSTIHVSSLMTIIAPVPNADPAAANDSKSNLTSNWSAVRNGVEAPPGMTALIRLPSGTPPAYPYITSRKGIPRGNS